MNTVISVAFAYQTIARWRLKISSEKKNVRGNSHYSFVYLAGFLKQKLPKLTAIWEGKGQSIPGGYSQKNWVGVCGPLPKTLALFMTKICDFPYPIYDLQSSRWRGRQSADGRRGHDKEVASSKKVHWRLQCKNRYPIYDQNGGKIAKIDTQFMTKTAEKPYPLGPHIPVNRSRLAALNALVSPSSSADALSLRLDKKVTYFIVKTKQVKLIRRK